LLSSTCPKLDTPRGDRDARLFSHSISQREQKNKPFEAREQLIPGRRMIVQSAATEQEHSMSDDPRNKQDQGTHQGNEQSGQQRENNPQRRPAQGDQDVERDEQKQDQGGQRRAS
jgi:hypothetical protein